MKSPFTQENLKEEKLTAIVRIITFQASDTGWSVIKVNQIKNPNDDITVTLYQQKVFPGATMEFFGYWTTHSKYGSQFKANSANEIKPATTAALEKYIGSGLIKGIGPAIAKRITKEFGVEALNVFENHIDKLTHIKGITESKLETIKTCWNEHIKIRDVMMFLQSVEISTLFAVKIFKVYGNRAVEIIKDNPYKLAQDIYGIGFLSSDRIALKLNTIPNSNKRIKAGINFALAGSRENGDCFLTQNQIINKVKKELSPRTDITQFKDSDWIISNETIINNLNEMEKQQEFKIRLLPINYREILNNSKTGSQIQPEENQKCYYSSSIYYDEEAIVEKILKMRKKVNHKTSNLKKILDTYYSKSSIKLSEEQENAVIKITQNQFSILTGGPGCGKTTTTKTLVNLLTELKKNVLLAAPTGRAAQRMSEVAGKEAKTIHRLLEWDMAQGGFKYNRTNQLKCDFLIVDETSMLDVHLAAAIFKAIPETSQLLFVGDIDQLPAIGAGNILKDIIASKKINVCKLTQIFRQASSSKIITYAHSINQGKFPQITSPFENPKIWQLKEDCMFIDTDEATKEQIRFINRIKSIKNNNSNLESDDKYNYKADFETGGNGVLIPKKFEHVNLDKLALTSTSNEELLTVLKSIHPYSTLNYGLSASEMILKLYTQIIPKYLGKNEIQLLTPMIKGSLGTANLNKIIQEQANPKAEHKGQIIIGAKTFRTNDRVIQKVNNYSLGVFNGDIGKIKNINAIEMTLIIEYPQGKYTKDVSYKKENLTEIDLAYAITIHKSQGSEFPIVIIPVVTQHFQMLMRNLIYTGLTRGKKLAIFIGSRKALAMAIRNQQTSLRQTGLEWRLKN